MLYQALIVGIGGFFGAIFRNLTLVLFNVKFGLTSPYGVLFVNTLGSLLAGIFIGVVSWSSNIYLKLFFVTGFLGAYTTFSAFSIDNLELLKSQEYKLVFLNIVSNIVLTLVFVIIGYAVTKKIIG